MQFDIQLPVTITLDKENVDISPRDSSEPRRTKILYSLNIKSGNSKIDTEEIYSDSPEELFNRLFKILIDNKIYTPQQ